MTTEVNELSEMKRELAALRDEVAALRQQAAGPSRPITNGAPRSRRELLRRAGSVAGLAAIGGVVATAAGSQPAAATELPFLLGRSNPTDASTEIRVIDGTPNVRTHLFSVQDGLLPGGFAASNDAFTGTRAMVNGLAANYAMHGGFFQSNSGIPGASGMRALAVKPEGYGIRMQGRKAQIWIDRFEEELPPPTRADAHLGGEIIHDTAGDLWFCVAPGTPGTWRKLSGPATSGQTHLLASPVRCYDSRPTELPAGVVKGPVSEPRLIDCRVTRNGEAPVVPADATGVIINVTVTETVGSGYVAVYPGGTTFPGTSLLNFTAGVTVANGTSVGCGPGARITVRCGGGVGHIIVDVMGYYR